MAIIKIIKNTINILYNPTEAFRKLGKRKFESVLGDYLKLLLTVGIVSSIASLIFSLGNAIYLNILNDVDVSYLRMINYALGRSTATIFLYLFAGTFFIFIFSLILFPFFIKLKYTQLLKILFYSLTPVLLFSWITIFIPGLFLWTLVLMIVGFKIQLSTKQMIKGTIKERD